MRRLICLLVLLAAPAAAQTPAEAGRVVGVVVDAAKGEPLPGATVRLAGTSLGASTTLDGQFVIEAVPAGEYQVEALYAGAEPWRGTVRVGAGETVGVWPTLEYAVLCDCVIVVEPPESISRGVYQARVVEYLGVETSCCTWWTVRNAVPVAHWETR
ncbi:carboxypeptidase-like regulatory domain-containing protein [Rubrivirga marina]|uniref:Carboxypeptidase regulatory-like domain-containing protein n=1 Tax=Rubrivirga marina TaxID=1196024 RepID=A0A271IZH8_9BACT|nr:carboxypeptidase-like regulatory domain-containing protein [Rubrivirga marina]PAP76487.1 hypothetical protein BSZ37_08555 [Rubrivirga marina]